MHGVVSGGFGRLPELAPPYACYRWSRKYAVSLCFNFYDLGDTQGLSSVSRFVTVAHSGEPNFAYLTAGAVI